MKRALVAFSLLLVLAAVGWLVWAVASGELEVDVVRLSEDPQPRGAAGACTAEAPCEVRIAFAATDFAARSMPEGRLRRVAEDDLAALRLAFRRSGIEHVAIAAPTVLERPIDAGQMDRVDAPANWTDPVGFNQRLLRWLPKAKGMRGPARRTNIVVVFSGFRGPGGACYANALAGGGYVVVPACMLDGYATDAEARMAQKVMLLHEIGHIFGAFHNDHGNPQPCREASRFGKEPTSCAWEQCIGRVCDAEELFSAPDAFCTLAGQYNYDAGPEGRSHCRAHTGGEEGSGWILEYSHPGKCRTPGYEAQDCGDAAHDSAGTIQRMAAKVARTRPRVD